MRAADFMTTAVVTTTASTSVKAATRQLLDRRIAAMPVVDDDERLVGIVSEIDMLRERVPADPRAHVRSAGPPPASLPRTVADVMTRDVYALPEAADQSEFAQLMLSTGVKSIPVVRGDRLLGIVGRRDLLRLLARDDALIGTELATVLSAEAASVGRWQAVVEDGDVLIIGDGTPEQHRAVAQLALTVPGVVRARTSC